MSSSQRKHPRGQSRKDNTKPSTSDWSPWKLDEDRNQYECYRTLPSGDLQWEIRNVVRSQSPERSPGVSDRVESLSTSISQVQLSGPTYSSSANKGTAMSDHSTAALSSSAPYYTSSAMTANAGSSSDAVLSYPSYPSNQQTAPQIWNGPFLPVSIASPTKSTSKTLVALLDSGSYFNFISLRKLRDFGITYSSSNKSRTCDISGMTVQNLGSSTLQIQICSTPYTLNFMVFDTNQFEMVLGLYVLSNLDNPLPQSSSSGSNAETPALVNPVPEQASYSSNAGTSGITSHPSLLSIRLYGKGSTSRQELALRDTGSLTDNWISAQIVKDLGLSNGIDQRHTGYLGINPATGGQIESLGLIFVKWGLPGQPKWTGNFHVWHSEDFNVIFGYPYMKQMQMVEFSNVGIAPLIGEKKRDPDEKKADQEKVESDNQAGLIAQDRREAQEARKAARDAKKGKK